MCGCDLVAGLSTFDDAHLAAHDGAPGATGSSGTSGSSATSGAAGAAGAAGASGDTTGTAGDTTGTGTSGDDDGGADATIDDGSAPGDATTPQDSSHGDANDAGPPNFLINPGFEIGGTSPWSTFTDNNGHQALLQLTTQFVHSGKYAGWLSQRTATFQGFVQDVTTHIVAGQQYQMSAWVMIQQGASADAGVDAGADADLDGDVDADVDADAEAGSDVDADAGPPVISDTVNLTAQVSCMASDGTTMTNYTPFVTNSATNTGWTHISGVLSALSCSKFVTVNVYVEGPKPEYDLYVDDLFFSTSP